LGKDRLGLEYVHLLQDRGAEGPLGVEEAVYDVVVVLTDSRIRSLSSSPLDIQVPRKVFDCRCLTTVAAPFEAGPRATKPNCLLVRDRQLALHLLDG
jgi:hypothetical protein